MYSTVMNTDHPKQSAAMNHGRPPRGGKAVVWDGGEGREGGRSGCGVWECLELQGRDRVSGRSGGGVRRDPVLTFVVGFASRTPHRAISTSPSFTTCLTRRSGESGEVGRAPVKTFLERPRPLRSARAVFQGTTLDVAHSAGPRPSSPRRSPVDGIDRGSPPHRTRAPVLPLTRVPRPCTPWSLSIHRKGTSQL
jgi:hypothetical protein